MNSYRLRKSWTVSFLFILVITSCTKCTETPSNSVFFPPTIWDSRPSWSPNDQWIAFEHAAEDESDSSGIYIIRPNGSDRRLIFPQGRLPKWSPDGEWLLANSSTDFQLYLINTNTHKIDRITNDSMQKAFPSWHPSGDKILFSVSIGADSIAGIWQMELGTGSMNRLIPNGGSDPEWDAVGEQVVFLHDANSTISIWNASDLSVTNILLSVDLTQSVLRAPTFNPKSNTIAFQTAQNGSREPTIWIYNIETDQVSPIVEAGWAPCWSPDGKKIAFGTGRFYAAPEAGDGYIWILDIELDQMRQITGK